METESQYIRNLINLVEYRKVDNALRPEEFDPKPKISEGQKSLIKGMYNSDYFSIENVTARLISTLK